MNADEMDEKAILGRIENLVAPYRVTRGTRFRLRDVDPGDTHRLDSADKDDAKEWLAGGVKWLADEQQRLYAQDRWSVLLIFQAMDAAGKDGTIKHVTSGVNPQGCQVTAFKAPSAGELDHDFMWRTTCCLPERGRIGIFNRSYYEEVLAVRVRPELLARQQLPAELVTKRIWDQRLEDIAAFERYLARNGTLVLKFFLHVSRDEQKRRFLERIAQPEKQWKFSLGDVEHRRYWRDYMRAYEDTIRATAAPHAPWFVVPADNKWFTRLVVAAAIVQAMERLDLAYPKIGRAERAALAKGRRLLDAERR